ncbi:transmembrane protein, putative (macronuclear) [Tetrahymena thermophila SB210]|uniref:Transmembrane protein, putative n=1 Tax=Tetrahymena thermophila (strain SB210) TaxID=312017 RepID=W7WW94_TETTS|nr:transmembrane protein, putative [Tetrahymena thermophila SB210]EWS71105.1 transmembrane protein, putative [Tetrahymena thermophila SB210]|eukprot:XP_012656348.1 transmembrane protein, putative [Tetrahymena thermophila SB210]
MRSIKIKFNKQFQNNPFNKKQYTVNARQLRHFFLNFFFFFDYAFTVKSLLKKLRNLIIIINLKIYQIIKQQKLKSKKYQIKQDKIYYKQIIAIANKSNLKIQQQTGIKFLNKVEKIQPSKDYARTEQRKQTEKQYSEQFNQIQLSLIQRMNQQQKQNNYIHKIYNEIIYLVIISFSIFILIFVQQIFIEMTMFFLNQIFQFLQNKLTFLFKKSIIFQYEILFFSKIKQILLNKQYLN